jgi:diguanylate cyclase (GGDEF)-like protein
MGALPSISEHGALRRSQFSGQINLVMASLLVIAVGLAALGIYWSTRQSDRISVERQVRMAEQAIQISIDDLALQQETVAIWDVPAKELTRRRPNLVELHDNMGLWLHNIFAHDEVFVLDGRDRPVQSSVEGKIVSNARYIALRPDLVGLLDHMRGRVGRPPDSHDRRPGIPLAPGSTVRTTGRATHDSDLVLVGGRPAAASVMLIQPSTPNYVRVKVSPVLISIRYLDGDFLAALGRTNLIENPRFSRLADPRPGEQSLVLRSESGKQLGFLIWRPDLPGSRIRGVLAPLNALAIGLLGLFILLLGRRLRSTITDLSSAEAQAAHLAFHDFLTGLPNRVQLTSCLDEAMAGARQGRDFSLLLIDLDQFKQVNDTLGHLAGDKLIREFGARVARLVRSGDTVARLGGDEFAIVLADGWTEREAWTLCAAILDGFSKPFNLAGTINFASASIGVARSDPSLGDGIELMRRADVALYRAKAEGRHCARAFEAGMDVQLRERSLLEAELREAVDREEFAIWYQAQVDRAGQVVGFEALLRWNHPVHGLVHPDRIISIAEETGLIVPIGDWVLRQAAATSARWPGFFIAVNLSPVQFRTEGFVERLLAIFREAGADPHMIELEVTERVLLGDHVEVRRTLTDLRLAGFRIALDDFGTGYCSLSYLKQFRVDKIKIDRSFVAEVDKSEESRAIVCAIVTLGHALGLTVTAEGVETRGQADLVIAAGCDQLQGYHFARPRPAVTLLAGLGRPETEAA